MRLIVGKSGSLLATLNSSAAGILATASAVH